MIDTHTFKFNIDLRYFLESLIKIFILLVSQIKFLKKNQFSITCGSTPPPRFIFFFFFFGISMLSVRYKYIYLTIIKYLFLL